MAVAQLSPASSISWSTLKPYSLKSSSSMCWASSCLSSVNTSGYSFKVVLICVQDFKFYPRYLMVWAMVDARLLLTQSFLWLLAAADSEHVPAWVRMVATLEVTRKPIPNRARTLNIQMDPNSCNRKNLSNLPYTNHNDFPTWIPWQRDLMEIEQQSQTKKPLACIDDSDSVCIFSPFNECSADTASSIHLHTVLTVPERYLHWLPLWSQLLLNMPRRKR